MSRSDVAQARRPKEPRESVDALVSICPLSFVDVELARSCHRLVFASPGSKRPACRSACPRRHRRPRQPCRQGLPDAVFSFTSRVVEAVVRNRGLISVPVAEYRLTVARVGVPCADWRPFARALKGSLTARTRTSYEVPAAEPRSHCRCWDRHPRSVVDVPGDL